MAESEPSMLGKIGKPIKHVNPLLKDFRDFAMRGNVIDLAVGVVIGAAFGKIVDALVSNVINGPLGLVTGKIDFSDRVLVLSEHPYGTSLKEAQAAHLPMIQYGLFLNAVINFLIISFTIFICVRLINKLYRKPEGPPAPMKDCPFCLSSIPLKATRCPQCTSTLPEVKA
jgi:large conductance mechanosensitive channel